MTIQQENQMIRAAHFDELETVLRVQKEAFYPVALFYQDLELAPLIQSLEEIQAESKRVHVLVFVEENEILGTVRGWVDAENKGHIGVLAVSPPFQKRGIGRQLMKAVEGLLRQSDELCLFTGEKSLGQISFYQSLGYTKLHVQPVKHYGLLHMRKMGPF